MLNEIVFQGIFGCHSPVRLSAREALARLRMPSSVELEEAHLLLVALFYPSQMSAEQRQLVEYGQEVKLAATFTVADRDWRMLRRDTDASMRLQLREGGQWADVTQGAETIEPLLRDKLRFAPFEVFWALNLWRFDEPLPVPVEGLQLEALEPRIRDIVLRYRRALDIEALDDEIQRQEQRVEEARERLGEGARLEEKLEQARARYDEIAITELSEDDLTLLHERDERLEELSRQVDRLVEEEEVAREALDETLPDKPWRDQIFWAGLALALGALAVSVAMHETMRPIAAANVLGFGMTAWAMLRYYTDMERAGVHIVRLDSIKRRLNQVRDEQVAFQERVGHLLIHGGVEDEAELNERVDKSGRLAEIIERMEEQLGKLTSKPAYQAARRELEEVLEELDEIRARREDKGDNRTSSYQLENDLKALGIDPGEALEALAWEDEEPEPEPYDRDELTRLHEIARRVGLLRADRLDSRVIKMWSRICGHVLGERFSGISLDEAGELIVEGLTDEQLEMWARTRPREMQLVASGLALSLLINLPSRVGGLTTLFVPDPVPSLSSEQGDRLDDVLESASRKAQLLLLRSG